LLFFLSVSFRDLTVKLVETVAEFIMQAICFLTIPSSLKMLADQVAMAVTA